MIKNYIIDTNVMIHDPFCFYKFDDNHIVIPIICIEELDHLKKREGIVGYHARSAARELSSIRKLGRVSDGVKLESGGLVLPELLQGNLYPNEFVHIRSSDRDGHEIIARYDGERIVPLKYSNEASWGLLPINREQKMAYELLMNPDIHFVTISGGAGSGKTILAIAFALNSC